MPHHREPELLQDTTGRMPLLHVQLWFDPWLIPALVLVLAFLPRAIYPISRSWLWHLRFLIAFNKQIHLNAPLAAFMMSALFLLNHPKHQKHSYMVYSRVAFIFGVLERNALRRR